MKVGRSCVLQAFEVSLHGGRVELCDCLGQRLLRQPCRSGKRREIGGAVHRRARRYEKRISRYDEISRASPSHTLASKIATA